ncbi:hypothetical protein CRD97_29535, partial [Escherichia coli]
WEGWVISLRQKQKKLIMLPSETMIWQPEFTDKTLSRKTGAVQSGYYNWVQHEPSDRKQSDERLKLEIKVAHIRTRETYGTRRLQ